ncbi:RNA polymerase sigma factor [Asticcacaulis sp. EMRT-3]|uniref:RNA polymerase sigma factor n=1 Tax=Asticcacaulis sp. EMRT-3 TaxID=3040349 RepID=UPI0024AFD39A|nr:RNA polymerase sigma factor [Asticcacaulis sp. EMRT-3]MDI7775938.1 RNA polymerase sigma factor [Asticcacaulis sp. EMRT-3]
MASQARIYDQYWQELCRVVRRKFGAGPPDPEEAAQAAFEQLITAMKTGEITNPRAFLHRCAYNYVIDHKRRQAVQNRYEDEIISLNVTGGTNEFDAQRVLEARERLTGVMRTVQDMEAKRRRILLLHTIDELSFAEIARKMSLSPTRVMQLFADALAQCARAARETEARTSDVTAMTVTGKPQGKNGK